MKDPCATPTRFWHFSDATPDDSFKPCYPIIVGDETISLYTIHRQRRKERERKKSLSVWSALWRKGVLSLIEAHHRSERVVRQRPDRHPYVAMGRGEGRQEVARRGEDGRRRREHFRRTSVMRREAIGRPPVAFRRRQAGYAAHGWNGSTEYGRRDRHPPPTLIVQIARSSPMKIAITRSRRAFHNLAVRLRIGPFC